eukprot:1730387-Alexandrium_andersonii.AAC.1
MTPYAGLESCDGMNLCVGEDGARHEVRRIHVYTDGTSKDDCAAWAFCVLAEVARAKFMLVCCKADGIELDPSGQRFI